jgi:DsbC/DsbD-like thiol-disulfide interchange protein
MRTAFNRNPRRRLILALAILAGTLTLSGPVATSQTPEKKKDSSAKVTVQAAASKTDAAGIQQITLKLIIEKGWYIYANPLENETYKDNETRVSVSGPTPPIEVKTAYPPGKIHGAGTDSYKIYEGEVILTTMVRRAPGDNAPLLLDLHVNSCSHAGLCLKGAEIKLSIPAYTK